MRYHSLLFKMRAIIFNDAQNFNGSLNFLNNCFKKDEKRFWNYEKYLPFIIEKIKSFDKIDKTDLKLTKTFFYSGRYSSNLLNKFRWNCNQKVAELNRVIDREKNLINYLSQQKLPHQVRRRVNNHVESIKKEYEQIKKNFQKEIEKQERNFTGQKELMVELSKNPFIEMKTTPLKQSDGRIYQKGIDVLIATDLVNLAHTGAYDIAILLSGDTDLIEAVKLIRSLGKIVVIISYHTPKNPKLSNISDLMNCGDYFLNLRDLSKEELILMSDLRKK